MKTYLVTIGIPVLTALLSFFGSVWKSKIDLKKQIESNKIELQKTRELCNTEIEKIKMQAEKQTETYEKNAQTDMILKYINSALENPDAFDKAMKKMQNLSNTNKYQFKR